MTTCRLSIEGLVAATFTPFQSNGDVAFDSIGPMVDFLVQQGLSGLYVLGSTGEGLSLTEQERCDVASRFVEAAAARIPVIVQVGSESLRQARRLAAHAEQVGADAISAVSPVYFKPDSVSTLVASMAEVAAGAPSLPFYYYHIPAVTGVSASIADFLNAARDAIPNFAGVKFTSPAIHEYQAAVEVGGDDLETLWGVDEMLLSGLVAGGRGAVGSTYNYAAPVYQRLINAFQRGDMDSARRFQADAQAIVRAFVPYGPRAAQKAIMAMIGYDCGPSRLPITPLEEDRTEALRRDLESIGFFDQIATSNQDSA